MSGSGEGKGEGEGEAWPAGRQLVVDARGQRCPMPVIRLARLVRELPPTTTPVLVTVLATDPAAASDVPAWCRMRGHRFVAAEPLGDHTAYLVEVGSVGAGVGAVT